MFAIAIDFNISYFSILVYEGGQKIFYKYNPCLIGCRLFKNNNDSACCFLIYLTTKET